MAVLHRLLLLIIWGFMALITLMIYCTSVSADEHLPTAGEILQNGKTLHKEVHLLRDINQREPVLNITHEYKTQIGRINYHIMYKEEYYHCYAQDDTGGYGNLSEIECSKLLQDPTYALE
jgi:hypothetical protein